MINYIYVFNTYSEANGFFNASSIKRKAGENVLSRFDVAKKLFKTTTTNTVIIWKCSSPINKNIKRELIKLGYSFEE